MASRLSWLVTPSGRKFSLGLMSVASLSVFSLEYCPQTFFISKYRDIVSMYQSAMPVPVSKHLRNLWNEILTDLALPEHEIKALEPFTVFGFDLFHAGTVSSSFGAIIGLPINFTYTDVSSVDPTPILVNNEVVNWNRQDAKQLLESLILSDDAKRYGIAREILMVRDNVPLISGVIASVMVSSTYMICRVVNEKFKLLERPFPARGIIYVVSGIFGFAVWATQIDICNTRREKNADTCLVNLNDNYAKGAIEFYSQALKRNVALRSLMGVEGEELYTPTGNEKFLFRQPRLPLEKRKEFFEKTLAERRRGAELLTHHQISSESK